MLWIISVTLVTFWLLGLATGYTTGLYIHVLCGIAIVLLVVSINREAMISRELNRLSRSRRCRKTH